MRIGIVAKVQIEEAIEVVQRLVKMLGDCEVIFGPEISEKLGKKSDAGELKRADAILAVGGDGTVLRAHRLAFGKPVLGINVGARGFLAEVEPGELKRAVAKLLKGELRTVERSGLTTQIGGKKLTDALNDVVIASARAGKTVSLEVLVNKTLALKIRGDGLIVATPTGSTAYTKAAGGPVLDPEMDGFVLVPICSSIFGAHSLVVPSNKRIEVKIVAPGERALAIVDGHIEGELKIGEVAKISISEKRAKFLCWKNFYRKLGEKLL